MDYSNVAFIGKNSESHNWNDPCKKRKINLIIHKHCKLDWSPPDKLEANETFNSKLACSYYESNTNRLFWWQLCNHLSTNSKQLLLLQNYSEQGTAIWPIMYGGQKKRKQNKQKERLSKYFSLNITLLLRAHASKFWGFLLCSFFFLSFFCPFKKNLSHKNARTKNNQTY